MAGAGPSHLVKLYLGRHQREMARPPTRNTLKATPEMKAAAKAMQDHVEGFEGSIRKNL